MGRTLPPVDEIVGEKIFPPTKGGNEVKQGSVQPVRCPPSTKPPPRSWKKLQGTTTTSESSSLSPSPCLLPPLLAFLPLFLLPPLPPPAGTFSRDVAPVGVVVWGRRHRRLVMTWRWSWASFGGDVARSGRVRGIRGWRRLVMTWRVRGRSRAGSFGDDVAGSGASFAADMGGDVAGVGGRRWAPAGSTSPPRISPKKGGLRGRRQWRPRVLVVVDGGGGERKDGTVTICDMSDVSTAVARFGNSRASINN